MSDHCVRTLCAVIGLTTYRFNYRAALISVTFEMGPSIIVENKLNLFVCFLLFPLPHFTLEKDWSMDMKHEELIKPSLLIRKFLH